MNQKLKWEFLSGSTTVVSAISSSNILANWTATWRMSMERTKNSWNVIWQTVYMKDIQRSFLPCTWKEATGRVRRQRCPAHYVRNYFPLTRVLSSILQKTTYQPSVGWSCVGRPWIVENWQGSTSRTRNPGIRKNWKLQKNSSTFFLPIWRGCITQWSKSLWNCLNNLKYIRSKKYNQKNLTPFLYRYIVFKRPGVACRMSHIPFLFK